MDLAAAPSVRYQAAACVPMPSSIPHPERAPRLTRIVRSSPAPVEYSKRSTAAKVQQLLSHNLFLLGQSPRPVRVEFALDDELDDKEGETVVTDSRNRDVHDPPPHFAQPGSLEFDFALKWRELQLAHKAESDQLAELHRQASTA